MSNVRKWVRCQEPVVTPDGPQTERGKKGLRCCKIMLGDAAMIDVLAYGDAAEATADFIAEAVSVATANELVTGRAFPCLTS